MNAAYGDTDVVVKFRGWFHDNGGFLHPHINFSPDESGLSVRTNAFLPADSVVASCPFSLAITADVARSALRQLLSESAALSEWTERQLICSYLCMHWIVDSSDTAGVLQHRPYIDILPRSASLRTSPHFTNAELEAYKGTNLYGATLDRKNELEGEWRQCLEVVSVSNGNWGSEFTWDIYLTAATYMSSRAFPSTLLSTTPSLLSNASSYPVLLPGVDALNHARGQPVTWQVSSPAAHTAESAAVSLVLHTPTAAGGELFNNYGPKPNAELILAYGFSLADNPDDTIVLKIAGLAGKWEVGRDAQGTEGVWEEVKRVIGAGDEEWSVEDELYAVESLVRMVEDLLGRLPTPGREEGHDDGFVRAEVALMLHHYVEGQRAILESMLAFVRQKEHDSIRKAQEQGLDIVFEEAEE